VCVCMSYNKKQAVKDQSMLQGASVSKTSLSFSSSLNLRLIRQDGLRPQDPLLLPPLGVLDVLGLLLHLLVLHLDTQPGKVLLDPARLLQLTELLVSTRSFAHDDHLRHLVSVQKTCEEGDERLGISTLVDLDDEGRRVRSVLGHDPEQLSMMRVSHASDHDDGEQAKDVLGELGHVLTGGLDLGVVEFEDEFCSVEVTFGKRAVSWVGDWKRRTDHSRGSRGIEGSTGGSALELVDVRNETKAAISSFLLANVNSYSDDSE
jgi:hypothetical protein